MVMGGRHGLTRKPRAVGIMTIFLGFCLVSSLWLTLYSIVRARHLSVEEPLDFTSDAKISKLVALSLQDPTLGGLLPALKEYEPGQCISRTEEGPIRIPSRFTPSPYLVAKLRLYENRHRKCAPKAVKLSKNGTNSRKELGDCQFVIWIGNSGLGNRMITILSAFVYALLTDRVLLLDNTSTDIDGLFCEPFPGTSWLLPENYDYNWMNTVTWENTNRLGRLLQMSGFGNITIPSPVPNDYIFLNLMHDYDEHDRRFFCSRIQKQLKKVSLLYWRSNNYVVPGLHFDHSFHCKLDLMFPERATAFHHMARYLFRPSNSMWGMILRFRQPYLDGARRQVGLQVRILESNVTIPIVADQLLACVLEKEILPKGSSSAEDMLLSSKTRSTSVLVTSLDSAYYETLRNYYLEHPVEGTDYIGVYSPSEELYQQYGSDHDKKAWADMYLLSLSNTLVTSPRSTFGYVAQALAGVIPWFLTKIDSLETANETFQAHGPCNRGVSLEPCFHAPPALDCEGYGNGLNSSNIFSFIKPCEDVIGGIKIMPSYANDITAEGKTESRSERKT
uniref:Fucosyltransferase n=2 Tax=Physcomitrium patens TaxID=3218 RepID=A0A7I4AZX2_PHYPA